MAKKIRFPLEMKDGIEVRDLEELRENFSLERVLFYLADGKLDIWLRDRYLDELADAVAALDKADEEINKKICNIFEVEYVQEEASLEKAVEIKRKMEMLEEFVDADEYLDVINQIAFDQEDLYGLLDEGENVIYLCGDRFSVPLGKKGIKYIGINNPIAVISSKEKVSFEEKDILFENVRFDEKYQKILDDLEPKKETRSAKRSASGSKYGSYCSNSYLNFMLSPEDRAGAKSCYEKICVLMEGLEYDIDADIRELREKLLELQVWRMNILGKMRKGKRKYWEKEKMRKRLMKTKT